MSVKARSSLFDGIAVNPTKLKDGLDFGECDRGAIAQTLQANGLLARVEKWLIESSFQFSGWLKSLPEERPAGGPGLILGDCALVKMWTPLDQTSEEGAEQAVLLSKFEVASGSEDLLIVTPLSPMFQALSGREDGDIVAWQSCEGKERATIIATLWLPGKVKKYLETSAPGEV
ncbi:MAG: hypothetical protein NUV80_02135 [Candidatus Berkelbacteria bacterium]|nr:hypothetical protein [Candidatus Berkelbacteria bacterium]MCR4307333.1 hypothetical protein [Candidatus Berkelbacteria bacterium]